jgi:hypothetical protein
MDLYLNESRGRSHFKALLGQANHLIVTALVGLDGVERGLFTAPPPDLHAAWSPQNPVNSARRARRLILDMVLVRAVDSVDVYIRMSRRLPGLIQDDSLRNSVDGAGRSVFQKVAALEGRYGSDDPVAFAMVLVMIAWRNKSAHEEADTNIEARHRDVLRENAEVIASSYRGLDIERLLEGFNASEPTFKESASLISAAQRFVQMLESILFRDLDQEKYLKELFWKTPSELSAEEARSYRKRRMQSIWGRDPSDRPAAVVRCMREFGITDVRRHVEAAVFPSPFIDQLCKLTPTEVYNWAKPQ